MSLISSGMRHEAVDFTQKACRGSMAIMLTDYSPDASWRLQVHVETADGGWFYLGAVDTIPPLASPTRTQNRLIAVASIPGALNWKVYAELLVGTPSRNTTEVRAEMKMSSAEEYAAGCCPLVAIPGNSVNIGIGSQTPTGAPPVGQRITLYTGSGFSLDADVAYLGAGSAFVQQHDAGSTDPLSNATMIGIGYPVAVPATQTLLLEWEPGRRFLRGFTLALSRTQIIYTSAAPETISAFGQWSTSHD